jgi:hypothetical protein
MRIDNKTPQLVIAPADSAQSAPATQPVDAVPTSPADVHTPSAELVHLLEELRQVPAVRQDLLQEIAQRLAAGEFRNTQSRDATVKALLGGQPG